MALGGDVGASAMAPMVCDVASYFNATANYPFVHSRGTMEPRDLLQALMDRDKETPTSLAARLKGRPSQPQLHKFLSGKAREPRRATLEPLAAHFGVPLDAFYDPDVADRVATALKLSNGATSPSSAVVGGLTLPERRLLADFKDLFDDERREIMEDVAARASKARGRREKMRAELLAEIGAGEPEETTVLVSPAGMGDDNWRDIDALRNDGHQRAQKTPKPDA